MKRRVLISSAEAVPAKVQHKKPCSDCPWARTALNGWLGDMTSEEWIAAAHGEATVECHALTGVQCAGLAIYRANNGKVPRDPSQLRLPADCAAVFANRNEFIEHHGKAPQKMPTDPTESQFEQVVEILTEVESDTRGVTREQYREFLQQVIGECEVRLEVIAADDARDEEARGSSAKPRRR